MGSDHMGNNVFPATTSWQSTVLATVTGDKYPLEQAKEVENKVNSDLESWSKEYCAVLFTQMLALDWTREKAHKIKLRMGLTQ